MSRALDTAYTRIREGILKGDFAAGERLKESALVDYCGVSRTPVRAALNQLAAEDFIEVLRNQGARVKQWTESDVDDLFALRALLEGYAASRAAERISLKEIEKIEKCVQRTDAALRTKTTLEHKIELFLETNSEFHHCVWEAAGSARLTAMLARLVEQALQIRTARTFTLQRLRASQQHHEELLQALRARDALWAEAIMRGHIRAARLSLLHPTG